MACYTNVVISDHPEATAVWHLAPLTLFIILAVMRFLSVGEVAQWGTTILIVICVMALAARFLPFLATFDVVSAITALLSLILDAELTLALPT